jgi:hypothetical protein
MALGAGVGSVRPNDPLAFASAMAVMTIASVAACFCRPGAPRVPIPPACCGIDAYMVVKAYGLPPQLISDFPKRLFLQSISKQPDQLFASQ